MKYIAVQHYGSCIIDSADGEHIWYPGLIIGTSTENVINEADRYAFSIKDALNVARFLVLNAIRCEYYKLFRRCPK